MECFDSCMTLMPNSGSLRILAAPSDSNLIIACCYGIGIPIVGCGCIIIACCYGIGIPIFGCGCIIIIGCCGMCASPVIGAGCIMFGCCIANPNDCGGAILNSSNANPSSSASPSYCASPKDSTAMAFSTGRAPRVRAPSLSMRSGFAFLPIALLPISRLPVSAYVPFSIGGLSGDAPLACPRFPLYKILFGTADLGTPPSLIMAVDLI